MTVLSEPAVFLLPQPSELKALRTHSQVTIAFGSEDTIAQQKVFSSFQLLMRKKVDIGHI